MCVCVHVCVCVYEITAAPTGLCLWVIKVCKCPGIKQRVQCYPEQTEHVSVLTWGAQRSRENKPDIQGVFFVPLSSLFSFCLKLLKLKWIEIEIKQA